MEFIWSHSDFEIFQTRFSIFIYIWLISNINSVARFLAIPVMHQVSSLCNYFSFFLFKLNGKCENFCFRSTLLCSAFRKLDNQQMKTRWLLLQTARSDWSWRRKRNNNFSWWVTWMDSDLLKFICKHIFVNELIY